VALISGHLRWIYLIFGFIPCGSVLFSLSCLALTLWLLERVAEIDGFWRILLQGVRFDLAPILVILMRLIPREIVRDFAY
jgi:hypothetical protein